MTTSSNSNVSSVVQVRLGKRSYPIYIGNNLLGIIGEKFKQHHLPKTVVVISDPTVSRLYLPIVRKSLVKAGFKVYTIFVPTGEDQKSLARSEKIYTQLLRWKVERASTIVALGGGVIGDLAGYIASTYQRGVGFVQIPTTLLAQVDSSVGGKVGINHPLAKNMIGAFYQPKLVVADIGVLKTLPKRELICGLGEIVKYGIILDSKFFAYINKNQSKVFTHDGIVLQHLVKRSCELKAYVVSSDEYEQNLRAILNFGHTIGHAIEQQGKYSYLKHGEAILYGMVAETEIAYKKELITFEDKKAIEKIIHSIPLPKLHSTLLNIPVLLRTMLLDKKVKDGNVRMVLPYSIGKVSLPESVTKNVISNAIRYLGNFAQ